MGTRLGAGIAVAASLLSGCEAGADNTTQDTLEQLNSPEAKVQLMKDSGFKVEPTGIGGMIFLPNGDGTYNITARLVASQENNDSCTLKTPTSDKFEAFTSCNFENWQAPQGFETKLASEKMDFETFWGAINEGTNDVPSVGGPGEVPHPLRAQTYTTVYNGELQAVEADVWRVCWDMEGRSSSGVAPASRADCRTAKLEMGDLKVKEATARAEDATAQAQEAKNAAEDATRRAEQATAQADQSKEDMEKALGVD